MAVMKELRIYTDMALSPEALDLLKTGTSGHTLIFPEKPTTSVLAQGVFDARIQDADVLFGQPDPQSIIASPQLKWIQISTSGITRYDTASFRALLTERKLPLCNSASVYNEHCAVHTLGFMLAQARLLPRSLASRAAPGSDEWIDIRSSSADLRGQSAVIIGYGAIGRRLVELLRPFNMRIRACRRSANDEAVPTIHPDELTKSLPEFDHVINILPDSAETRGFFDRDRFAALKPGAIFYNIGRGTTVDQDALLESLKASAVAAAWLDVTDPEPLPEDHPLRAQPNCHITPHVAGGHQGEILSLVRHFTDNLRRFTAGEPLLDRVM